MAYLILRKTTSNKTEALQVAYTMTDAKNFQGMYEGAFIVEILPKSVVKLARVSTSLLKEFEKLNVYVRIV